MQRKQSNWGAIKKVLSKYAPRYVLLPLYLNLHLLMWKSFVSETFRKKGTQSGYPLCWNAYYTSGHISHSCLWKCKTFLTLNTWYIVFVLFSIKYKVSMFCKSCILSKLLFLGYMFCIWTEITVVLKYMWQFSKDVPKSCGCCFLL